MIRNTLLLAVAVLAAVLIGGPLVFSFEMDNVQQSYVDALANKPYLKVVDSRFSRGWFSSDSRVTVALDSPLCAGQCPRVRIDTRIYHGPLPFGAFAHTGVSLRPVQGIAVSRIHLVPAAGQKALGSALPAMTATTVVGLGGNESIHFVWPAFKARIGSGAGALDIDSGRWTARYVRDATATELRARLAVPNVALKDQQGRMLSLHALSARLVRKLATPWLTDFNLKLARLRLGGAIDGGVRTVQQLRGRVQVDSDHPRGSGLLESQGSFGLARLKAQGGTLLGPALLRYHLRRFDAGVWGRIRERLRQIDFARDAPGSLLLSLDRIYRENGFALLHAGPSFAIPRLQVTTPSGDVNMTLHAAVAPLSAPRQASLPDVLRRLKLKLTALMPKPVALHAIKMALAPAGIAPAQVPQSLAEATLSRLTARHWLTGPKPGEPRYGFDLRLHDGALTLNGRPAPAWSQWLRLFSGDAPTLQ